MSDLGVSTLNKNRCVGCSACVEICQNGCIQMTTDEDGFLYPVVNVTCCTDCGLCTATCPAFHTTVMSDRSAVQVYAAWSLDPETRYNSTSGGVFTELAKAVLRNEGCVVGARYDERHMVYHSLVDREEDLSPLRQSKYIQSDMRGVFQSVRTALDKGKQILFVGTPCQCAALKRFVGKTNRLFLCDFICRGVNSPLAYAKYLEELETRYRSEIRRVWFKNKEQGWNSFGTRIEFATGEAYFGGRDVDPFNYGYVRKGLNLYMRPSCGQCAFKGTARPVDITLADFWGIKLRDSADDMRNGVSAVMLHTEIGRRLWDSIQCNIYAEEHTIDEILPGNACLTAPAPRDDKKSKLFYSLLQTMPFSEALEKISGGSI